MKYRVIGQNRDTGARMTLEFQSESKASAERKAMQQGMTVNRVLDITDGEPPLAYQDKRGPKTSRAGWMILLAVVIVAIWYLWPRIKGML
jgi:hypothetical protein